MVGLGPTEVVTPDSTTAVRVGTELVNTALNTQPGAPVNDGDIFDSGFMTNPAISTPLDTGQLAAGQFDLVAFIGATFADFRVHLEWRNAANSANLAVFSMLAEANGGLSRVGPLNLTIALNERIRMSIINGGTGIGVANLVISPTVQSVA